MDSRRREQSSQYVRSAANQGFVPSVVDVYPNRLTNTPGAKFYYLKTVIHNWPDHKVREILQNIIPAMSAHSVILIDEMVLPDSGVNWHATSMDLTMMALLAAVERTRTQWAELLDSVGLKIKKVHIYSPSVYEGVITVVRQ